MKSTLDEQLDKMRQFNENLKSQLEEMDRRNRKIEEDEKRIAALERTGQELPASNCSTPAIQTGSPDLPKLSHSIGGRWFLDLDDRLKLDKTKIENEHRKLKALELKYKALAEKYEAKYKSAQAKQLEFQTQAKKEEAKIEKYAKNIRMIEMGVDEQILDYAMPYSNRYTIIKEYDGNMWVNGELSDKYKNGEYNTPPLPFGNKVRNDR